MIYNKTTLSKLGLKDMYEISVKTSEQSRVVAAVNIVASAASWIFHDFMIRFFFVAVITIGTAILIVLLLRDIRIYKAFLRRLEEEASRCADDIEKFENEWKRIKAMEDTKVLAESTLKQLSDEAKFDASELMDAAERIKKSIEIKGGKS